MAIFPLTFAQPGDLVFFNRIPDGSTSFEEAVVAASKFDPNIFHVAVLVDPAEEIVVHATSNGVNKQLLADAIRELDPDYVELGIVSVSSSWKDRATNFAAGQIGAGYNDLFSPTCLDSNGKRAFYCCQLASEAYKQTNNGESPFLSHKLNFCDSSGALVPYWVEYYKKLCPSNPDPPQGGPGSHPSVLKASPRVTIAANRLCNMRKFTLQHDLVKALHFVGGARVDLNSARKFNVMEPRNGELLTECSCADAGQVKEAVAFAKEAQVEWAQMPWGERGRILHRTADLIRKHCNDIALWEVRDNGKPIGEAKADVVSCAETFEYFSGVDLSGQHLPYSDRDQRFAYTRREPFGVVGAIGAWNYPIQTATWKIAPAIACGNAIIYKPSPLAPVSSVILAQLLQCAGVPDGIVNILQGEAETGAAICESSDIRKVSFTGSVETGQRIAAACASRNVKPVTLELGGKSSCIVFDDSDVELAVHGALMANFFSQGQVCSNASKVLVHRSILDEFTSELVKKTGCMRIGDPMNEATHVGASISMEHMEKVRGFIKGALQQGAKLLYGGDRVTVEGCENGYYLSPCILSDIRPEMTVYSTEIFGSVLLIIPFETDEEALRIANDTHFGLAAGVFTRDLNRAHGFSARLQAGNVYINTFNDVSPYVPFGGYNQSGYGRENGKSAIESYTQVKSVFVNTSNRLENPFP
ncbi:Protein ALH-11 a [Aphelenchoides avenae]|nr:Protein ALH-11 a [Aphelenchus avenae]